jgi:hypothetical protein
MTEDIVKSAFRNTGKLLRYVLSGFVVLAVAWAVDKDHSVLKDLSESAGSYWPVLLLAPVFGVCIYSAHLLVCWIGYFFWAYKWALGKAAKEANDTLPSWSEAWKKYQAADITRWERRFSGDQDVKAAQGFVDSWSDNVHFRYCSVWALVVTPIVMQCNGRAGPLVWPYVLAAVVFALNMYDDHRLDQRLFSLDKKKEANTQSH